MRISLFFSNLPDLLQEGTRRLLKRHGIHMSPNGIYVAVHAGDSIQIRKDSTRIEITYSPNCFFRALGILLEHIKENCFFVEEHPVFQNLGIQLDVSRNGVLQVNAIKRYLDYIALMGYHQLFLYMEDIFFVPGRDYFGYMRGRYSAAELREIDDYAFEYGIEVIPSIQTLGHHEQYLHWDESADIRDTANELLADSEKTYIFIKEMIHTVMSSLRTKKIVLGLDEAHTLGLGMHLKRFGFEEPWRIFCRHLSRVFEITDELGLEGMIYSDMFFRMCNSDGEYYAESTAITPEIASSIPQNATLIYWHYGEAPGCDDYMLKKHCSLNRKVVFFGGTWTWSGILPNTDYAISATHDALVACKENHISDIVQTIWSDDGCECNHFYALLTLQYTAEYAFGHEDWSDISVRFHNCTGADAQPFLDMSAFQYLRKPLDTYRNFMELFNGKVLFWQDIMLGQADDMLQHHPWSSHYQTYVERFSSYVAQKTPWSEDYRFIKMIFEIMQLRCFVSENLVAAYHNGNRSLLEKICNETLPALLQLTQHCHQLHEKLWLTNYKPFGWEVLDLRYGGVEARIRYASARLGSYLNGTIPLLDELEETRLPMHITPWLPFCRIATATVKI